jgi:hypothetical protein
MWKNLKFLGRAAAFPLAFAIIALGVQARTDASAPSAPGVVVAQQQPLDLANVRAGWVRDHGGSPDRLTIASR